MEDLNQVIDHSHQLISSARVEGTPVFDPAGTKLGSVHSVMIHKQSGQVAYAVLSFGGFLGIGGHVYPIPWEMLTYDEERHGYVADISAETVRNAPSMALDETDRPREMEGAMYAYWDANPYW
jgi:hypothetical protein